MLAAASLLLLVGLAVWFSVQYWGNVVDDALISFRYAQNLVEGRGLVFNPGERVEGYTNFLWTMVLAGLYAIARDPHAMMPWAIGASILTAAAALYLVYRLGRELWGDAVLPTAVLLGLVALDNAYGVWAIQALEGHFVLVWMCLALLVAERRPKGWPALLGLALAAMQMTRWDAFLLAGALGASYGIDEVVRARREGRSLGRALAPWLQVAAVGAVAYGTWFAWRWSYYGHPLPNTFYLKVGSSNAEVWSRGLEYATSYFAERAWIPALAVLSLPLWGHPLVRAAGLFVVLHVLYVIRVGGDFYPGHRFLLVVTPFIALLIAAAVHGASQLLERLGEARKPAFLLLAAATTAVVAVVAIRGFEHGPYRTEILRWREHIQRLRDFNVWLRDYKRPGDVYAQGDIGGTGFFADIPVIDLYGVVDPEVAHQQVENIGAGKPGHEKIARRADVLARKPRFIRDGYLLGGDLERDGYFRSGAVPAHISADWLWERDDMAAAGEFLRETRLGFDGPRAGWVSEGEAFAHWPTRRPATGQNAVRGQVGPFVNSYVDGKGDDATGTLRSPPFPLVGDRMVLRVGGGNDPEELRVSLLVNGVRVFSETGHETEVLTRRVWDIAPWRGKEAILEIVDGRTGHWGHVMVDEVVQWRAGDSSFHETSGSLMP